MIGFVRGTVHAYGLDYVLIDVNGVGYRISFYHPESLSLGKEMTIYTYQNVREDEISLFGFLSLQEYDLFVKLISVKGLGPKIASGILSSASVDSIITAIETRDIDFMRRMPGVGNKTASQIILDLKGKLVEVDRIDNDKLVDVSDALKQLGYKPAEIKGVLKKLEKEDGSTEELIKKALSLLMK
ncbi:MAG: Holliday junction branch migration protein RuvA [Erysipelotrichaceae bacterium]|jgi:Holliday junction DNA helicase RuvA|nr:Holliday junction branch migration protein RuvA [Erysipelotrichaceae bacterium]MBQ2582941.1 Holliday junction branch migration protein RuvA [Erysipelotrichaceae bacterium]